MSKAFNLIERFSEDVDLVIDWRLLGYSKTEPWEERSKSAQEKFRKDSIHRTNHFLENEFISELVSVIYNDSGLNADIFLADEEETVITELAKDYALMQDMLFGNIPDFTEVLNVLRILEKEINDASARLKSQTL